MSSEDHNAFPLPFQWDDGEHFAPVVFTKEEELDSIRQIVLEGKLGKDSTTTTKPIQSGERIIDAGCGNGRVPFYIASEIYKSSSRRRITIDEKKEESEKEKSVV